MWLAATNGFPLGSGLGTHCSRKRRLNAAGNRTGAGYSLLGRRILLTASGGGYSLADLPRSLGRCGYYLLCSADITSSAGRIVLLARRGSLVLVA